MQIVGETVVIDKRHDKDAATTKKVGPWMAEWCGTLFVVHGFSKTEVIELMTDKISRVRELRTLENTIHQRKRVAAHAVVWPKTHK
jgi:hypothetical protein